MKHPVVATGEALWVAGRETGSEDGITQYDQCLDGNDVRFPVQTFRMDVRAIVLRHIRHSTRDRATQTETVRN